MPDLWVARDLSVLRAAVELCDEGRDSASLSSITRRTGFGQAEVTRSLLRLSGERPPFFDNMAWTFTGGISHVFAPTGHARRAVGQRSPAADRLVEFLELRTVPAERAEWCP